MATRSYIGVKNQYNGTVDYIYCHFDGYPSHNGRILTENYTTLEKVKELLALGDLSVLGPEIGEQQDFNNRKTQNSNWCLAYGRDRGEKGTGAKTGEFKTVISGVGVDYVYIFDYIKHQWECFDIYTPEQTIDLYNKPIQQTS